MKYVYADLLLTKSDSVQNAPELQYSGEELVILVAKPNDAVGIICEFWLTKIELLYSPIQVMIIITQIKYSRDEVLRIRLDVGETCADRLSGHCFTPWSVSNSA